MNETEFDAGRVDSYDYDLPRELIAQHPLDHRIDARLLLVESQDRASCRITTFAICRIY